MDKLEKKKNRLIFMKKIYKNIEGKGKVNRLVGFHSDV
jgi:hypothetical protein